MTAPLIPVGADAVSAVFSVECPTCDSAPDELCLTQTTMPGRRAVLLSYSSDAEAHAERVRAAGCLCDVGPDPFVNWDSSCPVHADGPSL